MRFLRFLFKIYDQTEISDAVILLFLALVFFWAFFGLPYIQIEGV